MSTMQGNANVGVPHESSGNTLVPAGSQRGKSQRVLACTLCQQRKVKCDRTFPCANCVKAQARCIPSVLTRPQRKRRFPERALLDRLRKYEELLREHAIPFEPLHKDGVSGPNQEPGAAIRRDTGETALSTGGQDASSPSTTVKSEGAYEAKSLWHAMSQGFRDSDDESDSSHDEFREITVRKAWDHIVPHEENLLFGAQLEKLDLSTLHPKPAHIFKLWQIYLDNVNPVLKVTHTPTLQARVVEAAGDTSNMDSNFEALIFSIYCISLLSLENHICELNFGESKAVLLKKYRFGCQQALSSSGFLRSSDRDCLTALFLYLVSIRFDIAPRSLSAMLGTAVRIAQRMGLYSEAALTTHSPFEAEMRRRLWWALVMFDSRMTELASSKILTLDPTWDCTIPVNVNDSEIWPEMKELPAAHGHATEALFTVLRSELGDYARHSAFHLDYTNPALKPIVLAMRNKAEFDEDEMAKLEIKIQTEYLSFCDEDTPLHFMTLWTTRASISKWRLLEHHAKNASAGVRPTEAARDTATLFALRWLECDTKIMTSTLSHRFIWYNRLYFPFPAHIHIAQDLKKRPKSQYASQCWQIISDHYQIWQDINFKDKNPIVAIFSKILHQAWDAYEAAHSQAEDRPLMVPKIISSLRETLGAPETHVQNTDTTEEMEFDLLQAFSTVTPMQMTGLNQQIPYDSIGPQGAFSNTQPQAFTGMTTPDLQGMFANRMAWHGSGVWPGWGGY